MGTGGADLTSGLFSLSLAAFSFGLPSLPLVPVGPCSTFSALTTFGAWFKESDPEQDIDPKEYPDELELWIPIRLSAPLFPTHTHQRDRAIN